ncbi:hypothetical protein TURU_081935 [Turdus rufiventris]|nr:hypothetical protein TURU_081935 [Turdus rufiventris]
MVLLDLTLALLAMTMVTTAIEEKPLDVALDSFNDQYQNCSRAMKGRGSPMSPLLSPDQAIAIMTYTNRDRPDSCHHDLLSHQTTKVPKVTVVIGATMTGQPEKQVIKATKATTATMATLVSCLHEVTVATPVTVATMVTKAIVQNNCIK